MGLPQPRRKKLPYPKSVFFIVSNEFCERFSYYGMRTILSLYLVDKLGQSEDNATVIYHAFVMMVYFFPFFGAMLADSLLGKFKTIFYISIIYAIGNVLLSVVAITSLNIPQLEFTMLGLLLVAIGTGGIKPCVSAFGGDQFKLPQQELQLAMFFSLFYFSINSGSLLSTAITPILRENFDYPLAFGVPGVLMVISIVIFVLGKPLYTIREPEGNMVIKISKCISHAIKTRSKNKGVKKEHWLDHAEEKYGKQLVDDIKATLKVLVLYIPLPVFWTLFEQQGTAWTFQARRMDGYIGFYTILPDQLQVVNPLLILAFIPIFQYGIYPLLARCNLLQKSLQRMVAGMFLAAVAFAISAVISLILEAGFPILPSAGNGQLRIYNTLPCKVSITSPGVNGGSPIERPPLGYYEEIGLDLQSGNKTFDFSLKSDCLNITDGKFEMFNANSSGYYFAAKKEQFFLDNVEKQEKGLPRVRTLINALDDVVHDVRYVNKDGVDVLETKSTDTALHDVSPGKYTLKIGDFAMQDVELYLGGVYAVTAVQIAKDKFIVQNWEVTRRNDVHMLWLVPQYIVLTMGEIMFSITGLEFSYSQAPTSMKSVLQACWLLTTAIGNLIVVIIQSLKIFEKQSHNFFLYAGLMLLDMGAFAFMAMRYKYVVKDEDSSSGAGDDCMDLSRVEGKENENGLDNPAFKKNSEEK